MERLQKFIASSGLTSRRKAEELITSGKVKVNGKVVLELGTKVDGNDEVEVNGKLLNKEDKVYYIINKPRKVITSVKDEHGRKTVVDIIEEEKRIFPVGRLDYDTTGLVLLTNDGELANKILHPKSEIPKVYVAKITGTASISGNTAKKPTIARTTTIVAGATNVGTGTASTTPPGSGYFVAVKSNAETETVSVTPTITTAGYGTANYHGIAGSTATAGALASDETYITVPSGNVSVSNTAITVNPTININSAGKITASYSSSNQHVPCWCGSR